MKTEMAKVSNKCIWLYCPYCGGVHRHKNKGFPWQEYKYTAPCNGLTYYVPDGELQRCLEEIFENPLIKI